MPSGSYRQVDVLCPFYASDNGKTTIACEGILPKTTMLTRFRRPKKYVHHIETACSGDYKSCEIYKILMTKYERSNDNE